MKYGVLNVQGDVTEHVQSLCNAVDSLGLDGEVIEVKDKNTIKKCSALVIPGGESTTLGLLLNDYGLDTVINELASNGVPIMGTCAGLILLAKEGNNHVLKTGQPLLSLMDVKVSRNAFGRQRDSFEALLDIPALNGGGYPGVFIRAPAIEKLWGNAEELCRYEDLIVMARQDNILAVAFHPELTSDLRIHEYFLKMI